MKTFLRPLAVAALAAFAFTGCDATDPLADADLDRAPTDREVWANPESPDVWENAEAEQIWANPESPDVWANPEAEQVWDNPESPDVWANPEAEM